MEAEQFVKQTRREGDIPFTWKSVEPRVQLMGVGPPGIR